MNAMLARYRRRLTRILLLCLALALLASIAPAQAEDAPGGDGEALVVYCYDKSRRTVARMLAAECHGSIISEAEAQKIRGQRVQAIQRALQGREQPDFADRRLASIGTGFFVSDGGKLLTNKHVVDGCGALSVETPAGGSASAKLLRTDDQLDLALLQASITSPAIAVFQPHDTSPGSAVALIGYPDQGLPPRTPFMSVGAMVPLDRAVHGERIAVRADVRHGNSGGPLLDQWGNVIGIINAKINTVKVYQETKRLIRNVGFAIPTPAILRFLDQTGTAYRLNALGSPLNKDQLFEKARTFVVRVGCWK